MKASSTLRLGAAIAALLASAPFVLLTAGSPPPSPRGCRAAPGVVLLCIDTLRADCVDPAGGEQALMPRLDEFARGSTVFADASASAAWTGPSVSTMLTGLLPSRHGVHGVCGEQCDLVSSVRTVAEVLRAAGWSTAAFTGGGWVAPEHGLAQGFGAFGCTFDGVGGPEASIARWAERRSADAPFFLFLHTYAAHEPYGARSREAARRNETSEAAAALAFDVARIAASGTPGTPLRFPAAVMRRLVRSHFLDGGTRTTFEQAFGAAREAAVWDECMRWIDTDFALDPDSAALASELRTAYEKGVREADDAVSRTLAALRRAGVPGDAAVIVTGDHGEAFGEHGTLSHGRRLYDELVHVPLVVHAPGRLAAGAVVRGSCGLVDVMPTILDLAGLPPATWTDGRSLLPLARGEERGHPIVAQEVRRGLRDGVLVEWQLTSVRTESAKFIQTVEEGTGAARSELFDLAADPGEQHPLVASESPRFGMAFAAAVERVRRGVPVTPERATAIVKPLASRTGD